MNFMGNFYRYLILVFLIFSQFIINLSPLQAQNSKQEENENEVISKIHRLDSLFWKYYYSDYEKAYQYMQKGLRLSRTQDYKKGIVEHLNNKGVYFQRNNNYDSAFVYIHKSYELSKRIDYKKGLASSLNNLGLIYRYRGMNDKALEVYLESLKILQEIEGEKRNIASSKNNIGAIFSLEGDQDKALKYFNKALEDYKEIEDKNYVASTLSNIGGVYSNKNNYDKALKYYRRADSIYSSIGYPKGVSEVHLNTADVYLKKKQYKKSITYSKKSLEISKKLNDMILVGTNYINLGIAYLRTGKIAQAMDYLQKTLQISRDTDYLQLQTKALELLSEAYARQNRYKEAYQTHRTFQQLNDSLLNKTKKNKVLQLEMQYKLDKKLKIKELERKREEKMHELEMKKQKILTYSALAFAIMAIIFAIIIFRALRSKQYVNRLLKEQKSEVLNKNEELRQSHEEILAQRDEIQEQKKLATDQRDELRKKSNEMKSGIEYARHIQTALLPPENHFRELLKDYFILYKPKDIVSGDFYWVYQRNNKIYVAVSDCTGHGVPGAFMSLLGLTLMNEVVNEFDDVPAGKFLDILKTKVTSSMHQRYEENARDGMEVALCIFDFTKMKVDFAGAYNPMYLIRNNKLIETKGDRMAICYNPQKDSNFTSHELPLYSGDMIYLFTDGYADQVSDNTYKKFRKDRFKETLLSIHKDNLSEQKDKLEKRFLEWKGNYEQIDDILIVGIKI
jgi:serine phosphatase RsbU (regulator of sigma subunit)/Tfp pilus assembly protein PilF